MQWFLHLIGYLNNKLKIAIVASAIVVLGFGSASFAHNNGNQLHFNGRDTTTDKSLISSLSTKKSINYLQQPIQVELNPLVRGFVQQYAAKQTQGFEKMKSWGKPYFDLYDQILPQYGIPKQLKYLSVIESYLQPGTISWAGAVGPWQLMPYEGTRYGLRMNQYTDERMDFYKSTHAACKLMKELYETFGDWLLVVAAYNGGVGRVKQCIRKAGGSTSFWDIQYYLPEETRTHVKKYIATHFIFEGSGGWTTMTAKETEKYLASLALENKQPSLTEEELKTTTVIEIGGRYLSFVVSNYLLMDIDQFNKWNPGFDKTLAEGKKYALRLSKERAVVFEAKKSQILLESVKALLNGDNATTVKN
jgi:membrane-bound lytic murein transglycosylase D